MATKNNNTNGNKGSRRDTVSNDSAKSLPPTYRKPPVPKVKPSKSSK
jgi:hypothetical protein